MINIETLQKGPFEESDDEPKEIGREEFTKQTKNRVQRVVDYINARYRFHAHYGTELIEINGGHDNIETYDDENDSRCEIEAGKAQEALFNVMREFGIGERSEDLGKTRRGYSENSLQEFQYYPSNKIKGLYFKRERSYYADSGQTFEVKWYVEPKVSFIKFPPF